jgi:DNA-3-methyladenine glycosylase
MILKRKFYERDTLTVAKELLGKSLVHETAEGVTIGKIVETEAYMGPEDKASHAYGNLRTERTEIQFGPKGYAYIYLVYGMYSCFNVTSGRFLGKPEAILVRALEPIKGFEIMTKRRGVLKDKATNLTDGPGRLCIAMELSTEQNGVDLCVPPLHIDNGVTMAEGNIAQTTRVNVDYADEWKNSPWRFFIKKNAFVSKQANKQESDWVRRNVRNILETHQR